MFSSVFQNEEELWVLNIYSFLNKRRQIERFIFWTKRIIFGIINNEIQKMDFKLVECV